MRNLLINKPIKWALPALLLCSVSTAQVDTVTMDPTDITETTFDGNSALSILQSGDSINNSNTAQRFTFDRLMSVDPGALDNSGWTLAEVNVTIRMLTEGANLKLENDSETQTYEGGENDSGSITFTLPTFSLGAETSPLSSGAGGIEAGNYLTNSPVATLDLDNVDLDPGEFVEVTDQGFDESQSRPVDSNFFGDYDSTGQFDFDLQAVFAVTFTGSGADLEATQNFGNSTFFTEVEYIVIPEPGTLMMAGIALGSAGLFAFARRRKRS